MHPKTMYSEPSVPKWALTVLNQVFELERKLSSGEVHDPSNFLRHVTRIKDELEELGIFYEDPLGQPFTDTRTDLEATIAGNATEMLKVVEVIKPIIRAGTRDLSTVTQKGIVIVESQPETGE